VISHTGIASTIGYIHTSDIDSVLRKSDFLGDIYIFHRSCDALQERWNIDSGDKYHFRAQKMRFSRTNM